VCAWKRGGGEEGWAISQFNSACILSVRGGVLQGNNKEWYDRVHMQPTTQALTA